jgi:hypothetical protein
MGENGLEGLFYGAGAGRPLLVWFGVHWKSRTPSIKALLCPKSPLGDFMAGDAIRNRRNAFLPASIWSRTFRYFPRDLRPTHRSTAGTFRLRATSNSRNAGPGTSSAPARAARARDNGGGARRRRGLSLPGRGGPNRRAARAPRADRRLLRLGSAYRGCTPPGGRRFRNRTPDGHDPPPRCCRKSCPCQAALLIALSRRRHLSRRAGSPLPRAVRHRRDTGSICVAWPASRSIRLPLTDRRRLLYESASS